MTQTKTLKIAMIEDEPFSRLALMEILKKYPYHHKEPELQLIYSDFSLQVIGCVSNTPELITLLASNPEIEVLFHSQRVKQTITKMYHCLRMVSGLSSAFFSCTPS